MVVPRPRARQSPIARVVRPTEHNGAMADADLEAAIEQLYAVPLDEFVAERKRLARELRSSGARPAAAEVAKLAKPTAPAWALNLVAREDPDAVDQWLATADGLRDASANAAEVGGDALRAAMAAHRTATGDLIALVRERARPGGRALSEPMVDRVRALLQAATVDPGQAERLRAGRVSEDEAAAGEPAPPRAKRAGGEAAPAAAPRAKRAGGEAALDRAAQAAEREAAERAERHAELERRVAEAADEAERLTAAAAR